MTTAGFARLGEAEEEVAGSESRRYLTFRLLNFFV